MKPPKSRPDVPHVPASTVNPDAGAYTITGDPDERAAAEAAARATWEAFPYYERRYGERGWRFSLSDSGWIATLCALPPDTVREKVEWLQGLLAVRGMPSYLLESHLDTIVVELTRRVPDAGDRYAVLGIAAKMLRDERTGVLPAADFDAIARAFDDEVRMQRDAVPAMGAVLASALVDDALGIAEEQRVFDWARDRTRFGADWTSAVERFRLQVRPRLGRVARR